MEVSEEDLDEVLVYCRALAEGAATLEAGGQARSVMVAAALEAWRGPLARAFGDRSGGEADDLASVTRAMRDEADDWAQVWADTVNAVNQRRRAARVADLAGARSAGERVVDLFVGDESDELVRPFSAVAAPTADTGYAPTGGLENY